MMLNAKFFQKKKSSMQNLTQARQSAHFPIPNDVFREHLHEKKGWRD